MSRLRSLLISLGIVAGIALNVTVAPQIMTPRPPVFNGPDIAENWEWRSMAIHTHGWWLWEQFPGATVVNAGFVEPPGNPDAPPVGLLFKPWVDEIGLDVDFSQPALDVSGLDIRDDLAAHQKVYSRIHCRSSQDMEQRDTCYYFVAWDDDLIPDGAPTFVAVLTNANEDDEEMALVEKTLLERISPVAIEDLLTIDEIRSP